jgi:hypothetical protein
MLDAPYISRKGNIFLAQPKYSPRFAQPNRTVDDFIRKSRNQQNFGFAEE